MEVYQLNEREKSILRYVIHQFILTAAPVGSRNISKKYDIGLSPASVRNIMSDLEEFGFLGHPHTSAGRVPTDKGYRFYVDSLMEPTHLDQHEKDLINSNIDSANTEADELIKITSFILSDLTNQLACVTYPKFDNATLEKIQIVQLSSTRILVVISVKTGMVRTITLEISASVDEVKLEKVQRLLNERLSGLKFSEIKSTFKERIKDTITEDAKPIIRVLIDSIDKIFADVQISEKAIISGAKHILKYPEFGDQEHFQSIIELIENKEVIIHIMDQNSNSSSNNIAIKIGEENNEQMLSDYSLISKKYEVGQIGGSLGIVGPKRMEYSKVVAAVVYVAEQLSKELKKSNS